MHATIHVSRSEDNLQELVFSMWVQGIKRRLLSLEANTSTRSPAAGLRNTKGVTDVFSAVYLDGSVEILDIYALTLKQMAYRAGEMARKCICTAMKTWVQVPRTKVRLSMEARVCNPSDPTVR